MLNQVVLVGRLVRNPELKETETGKKVTNITIAVPRSYKNVDGQYEADYIDCTLWTPIAESTTEYCKKGDVIGVRGRVQSRIVENEDGSKYKKMEIIAEKVTFLSSSKNTKEITEEEDTDNEGTTDKKSKKKK